MNSLSLTTEGRDLIVSLRTNGAELVCFPVPAESIGFEIARALLASPTAHPDKAPSIRAAVMRLLEEVSPYTEKVAL
jgi:hypothetical protein